MKHPLIDGPRPIKEDDIPTISLYMDQVTLYLDKILSPFKVRKTDKILTKTMINNYVKAGVIAKPEKKKYGLAQLMDLIMVYRLKNVLSLEEVKRLFKDEDKAEKTDTNEYWTVENKEDKKEQDKEQDKGQDKEEYKDEDKDQALVEKTKKDYQLFLLAQEKAHQALEKELEERDHLDQEALLEMALKADLYKRILDQALAEEHK